MSLEELMQVPMVVSASKREESLVNSPSVIRVIGKEEIRTQGLESLNEVLARTVGFYPGNQPTWPSYGSRGIINAPRQYLMLIDGCPQNSIVAFGALPQHTYPLLEKVERIEVISGPGSTLWGSDALLGIINIVTKDGEVGEKVEISENIWAYDTALGRDGFNHSANMQYSFGFDEKAKGIVSATFFDGDGYSTLRQATKGSYALAAPQLDWSHNGEVYSKININNLTVKARFVEGQDNDVGATTADYYNYDTTDSNWQQYIAGLQQMWIEAEHKKEFSNGLVLSTKLFAQKMEIVRTGINGPGKRLNQQSMRELSEGLEAMLSGQRDISRFINNYKVGFRYTTTKVGPHFKAPTENVNGNMWYLQDVPEGTVLVNDGMAVGTDNMYGVYAEDNITLAGKYHVVVGGRVDLNDLREKKSIFLPRFALIDNVTDNITLKYLYNTGYRRPGVRESSILNSAVSSVKSEEVAQHDVQLLYHAKKLQTSLTLYHLNLTDPIVFEGGGYKNIGDTTSKGIEVDAQYRINKKTRCYGNCSYADATSESPTAYIHPTNKRYTGIPSFMYNLGVDYNLAKGITANLHLRGWDKNYAAFGKVYAEIKGSYSLDINLIAANLFNSGLEVAIYSANVLNNDADYALIKSGTFQSEPRAFGVKAKYTF